MVITMGTVATTRVSGVCGGNIITDVNDENVMLRHEVLLASDSVF